MDRATTSRIKSALDWKDEIDKLYDPQKTFTAVALGALISKCLWNTWSGTTARLVAGEYLSIKRLKYSQDSLDDIDRGVDVSEVELKNTTETDSSTEGYSGAVPNTPEFIAYCELYGIPIDRVSSAKFCNHQGQAAWNVACHFDAGTDADIGKIRKGVIEAMQKHSPQYNYPIRPNLDDPELAVISLSDIHVGKLAYALEVGSTHDNDILRERIYGGIERLLAKIMAGRQIEKIVLVNGGDALHTDAHRPQTTGGTSQDTDGTWYGNFIEAKKIFVDVIERCLQVAPVHFIHLPSNHDWVNGTLLADTISTWFRDCEDFTSDCSLIHRKYFQYGNTLVGLTHGDGAKEADLPDLMKTEARVAWAQVTMGVWITNHIHHKDRKARKGKTTALSIEKEYSDVLVINRGKGENQRDYAYVEYMRTPTGSDSWHNRNGYDHQIPAIEAFILHPEHGQHARITEFFNKVYRD